MFFLNNLRILFFIHQLRFEMFMNIVIITSHFLHYFHSSFFFFDSILLHLKFLLSSFFSKLIFEVSNLRSLLLSHCVELFQPLFFSLLYQIQISFFMLFKSIPVINDFSSFHIFKSYTLL